MRNAPFRKNLGALTNKAFRVFLTGSIVLSFSPATALANEVSQDGSAASALTSWTETQKEEPADTSATNIDSTSSSVVENATSSEGDYTQFALSPATLSALEAGNTYTPGVYVGNATVTNKGTDDWTTYQISVNVTIDENGKISAVALTDDSYKNAAADSSDNETYLENAELGTRKATGVAAQIVQAQSVEGVQAVSGATYSSAALVEAVVDALAKATADASDGYVYLYAAVPYSEYYASEVVQAAGSNAAGTQVDTHNEADTGAFDVVSRATTNHGLHRGSYQNTAIIYGTSGATYKVNSWNSGSEAVLEDGSVITFSRGNITAGDTTDVMDHYEITGFKYVPVAVKSADLDAFKAKYTVVENGGALAGGYTEQQLNSYNVVANVDANTNGLKVATKNDETGDFSFGKRQVGTTSGVKDSALKVADVSTLGVTTKNAKTGAALAGSYGDFLRVDLKSNYGDLGANMQAVFWEYYGSGDTVLATYGTKFAADNWMHKSNGIQLGLTESARCTLPQGTDGTGKWKVTICALGYEDTVLTLDVDESDINNAHVVSSTEALEQAISAAEALTEADYTVASWASLSVELGEAKEQLALAQQGPTKTTQEAVDEATFHLNEAIKSLVHAGFTTWAANYAELGVDTSTGYDAVSSATNFTSRHAKDIPTNVQRATDENGTVTLTGVNKTAKESTVSPAVSSSSFAYSNKYGTGEFVVVPDDTVEGYVWNEYLNAITAITISDGTTTVGTLPWIDYYGENSTAGFHYNKIEIAVNNGESVGSNKANVTRFAPFYNEGASQIKAGTYTITVYADGYQPLSTSVNVLPTAEQPLSVRSTYDGAAVKLSGMPEDMTGATATVSYTVGSGRNAKTYYLAQDAAISNGVVKLSESMVAGTTYTVAVNSANYAPMTASFTQQAEATLTLDLATTATNLKVGDTFNVAISMKGDKITTAQGTLSFDDKVVRLTGFSTENSQLSEKDNFKWTDAGMFSFFGNDADFTEGGVVAQAQFEVIGAGATTIALDSSADNVASVEGSTRDHAIVAGAAAEVSVISAQAVKGDVNNNGAINIVDAQIAYDLATKVIEPDYAPLLSVGEGWSKATVEYTANVNGDDAIDAADAFAIQHYALFKTWE